MAISIIPVDLIRKLVVNSKGSNEVRTVKG
jgi:hypothetical protein